jgi:hypothetical protein
MRCDRTIPTPDGDLLTRCRKSLHGPAGTLRKVSAFFTIQFVTASEIDFKRLESLNFGELARDLLG